MVSHIVAHMAYFMLLQKMTIVSHILVDVHHAPCESSFMLMQNVTKDSHILCSCAL